MICLPRRESPKPIAIVAGSVTANARRQLFEIFTGGAWEVACARDRAPWCIYFEFWDFLCKCSGGPRRRLVTDLVTLQEVGRCDSHPWGVATSPSWYMSVQAGPHPLST